jgi:CRISPR-associated protein Csm4
VGATYIYRLAPRSAFHFGLRGVGIEETATFCPADTLFSALCLTLREWEPEGNRALESWLARFPPLNAGGPPPLRLSSALPYAGQVLFFPKPMLPANIPAAMGSSRAKTFKKMAFVSLGVFSRWLGGQELEEEVDDDQFLHAGRVWVTRDERQKLEAFHDPGSGQIRMWAEQTVPRVTIDRMTSRSSVYQAGVVRFRQGAGLFVLAEFLDGEGEAEARRLATLFEVLGHGGLGGERSSGYGQFGVAAPQPFGDLGAAQGDLFLTLSPYHPTAAEVRAGVLGEGASYNLLTRRGWVGSPEGLNLRRRLVRLLGEGSVLHRKNLPSLGDLADVTPRDGAGNPGLSHNVWRYGIAFPVPVAGPLGSKEGA